MATEAQNKIPVANFDLSHIDPKHRFDIWKDSIGNTAIQAELPDKSLRETFNTRLTIYHLSSILLGYIQSSRQYQYRTNRMIAQDDLDHFLIQYYRQGSLTGQWAKNNHSTVRAGDIIFLDLTRSMSALLEDYANYSLIIPRQLLIAQFPSIELRHGTVLPGESIYGKLLGEHILSLYQNASGMEQEEGLAVAQGVIHLTGHYFSQTAAKDSDEQLQASNYQTIRRYIINNIENPALSPDFIAAHFKISRAYLYRLFNVSNGIAQFIKEQRLIKAFALLNNPIYRHKRISDIGYSLGFNSDSHFSRSFYSYFGISPTEVRRNALTGTSIQIPAGSIDRSYEQWVSMLR